MMLPKFIIIFILILFHERVESGELAAGGGWTCGGTEWLAQFICDGHVQCDDDSDEGKEPLQGCNLFPDSGCPSPKARRLFKCHRTEECFEEENQAKECETRDDPPTRECSYTDGPKVEKGWKCKDGRCIRPDQVCDDVEHCDDGSDESRAWYDGCNMFPNFTDHCPSLGGERHVLCPADDATCIPAEMQHNINMSDVSTCHACPSQSDWRCNDGRCINATLHKNGVPDCLDSSDEPPFTIYWWFIFIATILIVLFGIIISLVIRRVYEYNKFSCFHCSFCSSSRRRAPQRYSSVISRGGDEVDCGGAGVDDDEEDDYYPDSDIPCKMIELLDDRSNWQLKDKEEKQSRTSLKPEKIPEIKREYLTIHQSPILYHHLYSYIVNRNATQKNLAKVVKHLYDFEREFHSENKLEVYKCWRLHLGASDLTKDIIASVADEKFFMDTIINKTYPARQSFRNCRRKLLNLKPLQDGSCYKILSLGYAAVVPFVEGCFFYIERLKNLIYIHIFYLALCDLSKDKPSNHPFEHAMVICMALCVGVTQFIHVLISFYYAEDIFEVGHTKDCQQSLLKRSLFKVGGILLSPFIPVFVLSNHIFYEAKFSRNRRHLQTFKDLDETEANDGDDTTIIRSDTQRERIKLYKQICKLKNKSMLYRQLYSYFRITSAIIESCTMIVCLFLLLFVTSRSNRDINLIIGVEHRLYTFFDINIKGGLFEELNIMRDIVIFGSVIYSFFITLTALVKYWYQSKALSINIKGLFTLFSYMFFMVLNKLTTITSLFANTQPSGFSQDENELTVSLLSAFIIFSLFLVFRISLVYFYKRFFSTGKDGFKEISACCKRDHSSEEKRLKRGWETGDFVSQWINVIVNCIVVTPFMVQKETLKVLKDIEKEFSSPQQTQSKRDSLRRRKSLYQMERGNSIDVVDDYNGVPIPNSNVFVNQNISKDLREVIRLMWWENPTTKLDVEKVKNQLDQNKGIKSKYMKLSMNDEEIRMNIKITLEQMESVGIVNTPLLNPVSTKREYFWLFLIVVLENIIALSIELLNGGVSTGQGRYYSWDIRLFTFFSALLSLLLYYSRFHMTRDLRTYPGCGGWINYLPVCLCCKPDQGMTAMPNEVEYKLKTLID